jgi:hypothetical protein
MPSAFSSQRSMHKSQVERLGSTRHWTVNNLTHGFGFNHEDQRASTAPASSTSKSSKSKSKSKSKSSVFAGFDGTFAG